MIKAINKDGRASIFTEKVWNLMTAKKNGFVELGEAPATIVPHEIIEFKAKISEQNAPETPILVAVPHKSDNASQMEIMRDFLKRRGVKSTHLMGYDKLKKLYDENNKSKK